MINFIKRLFGLGDRVKGAVVSGKLEGKTEESYIPYSVGSGDNAVIATEQYVIKAVGSASGEGKVLKGSIDDKDRSVFECQLFDNVVLRFSRDSTKIGVYIYGINGGEEGFTLNYISTSHGFVNVSCINNAFLKDSVVLDEDCLQNSESNISMNIYNSKLGKFYELKAIVADEAKLIIVSLK